MKKGRGNKAGQVRAVRTRLGKARKEKEKGRKEAKAVFISRAHRH